LLARPRAAGAGVRRRIAGSAPRSFSPGTDARRHALVAAQRRHVDPLGELRARGRKNDLASVVRPKGRFDCHCRYLSLPIDRYAKQISGPRHISVAGPGTPSRRTGRPPRGRGSAMSTTSGSSRTPWSKPAAASPSGTGQTRPVDQSRGTTGHPGRISAQPSTPTPPSSSARFQPGLGAGQFRLPFAGQYWAAVDSAAFVLVL
jgi:hypothetical protein